MSQTRWQQKFKPARYGAVIDASVSPVRELIDPGDLGGADLCGHELLHYLRTDRILVAIFGTRYEFMPWRNLVNFKSFPRLGVYLGSSIDSERPTNTAVEKLTLYVGIWWDGKMAEPVPEGEASSGTVFAHLKRVVRSDKAKTLVVWKDGSERSLVLALEEVGAERFAPVSLGGNRVGFLSEIPLTYRIHTQRTAAVPYNLI